MANHSGHYNYKFLKPTTQGPCDGGPESLARGSERGHIVGERGHTMGERAPIMGDRGHTMGERAHTSLSLELEQENRARKEGTGAAYGVGQEQKGRNS